MALTTEEKKQRRIERQASDERIAKAKAETLAVVATGKCPICGSKLRRNSSIAGWWQCEQLGAVTHRARPNDPPCSWQGFTE